MMTKKITILGTGALSVAWILIDYLGTDTTCGGRQFTMCMQSMHSTLSLFLPVVFTFLFSLLTAWMRDAIYESWFRFARWWVPISMLLILITPEYGGGLFNPVQKGSVAFVLTALFVVISIILIIWKHFADKA